MDKNSPAQKTEAAPPRKIHRSYFTRKLEKKLEEKGMDIPQKILSILDIPFRDFTPEQKEIYETSIKPLAFVFAEHLLEVYEAMGSPRNGWEEMAERLDDCPVKVIAMLVIYEEEKLEEMEDQEVEDLEEPPPPTTPRKKIKVKVYQEKAARKERWWEKKIF